MTQTTPATSNPPADGADRRDLGPATRRGFFGHCPRCGEGGMFRAYLKVVDACPACGEDLSPQRADDAPPYITMLIVGHFIVAGVIAAEELWPDSPLLLGAIVWTLLAAALSLIVLPRVKGALVGYQWAMRMHGFGGVERDFP
ncbi:MAG: DUF983 domain-containing protein [Roseiarcus sp.]|jgi:uncharacterized protein (DUF983 family)